MGKIIENYELKEQLGEGVYAKVHKAVHLITKQEVAIKVVQAEKFRQIPKLEECTVNEINILATLQSCPFIVKYIDMLKTANNFYFVYEYCNGGTLDKLMLREGPFPEKRALGYFRQIVEAFKVLSKNNIMHRDIKPDNILLHNGMIKIADFGFCKPLDNANQLIHTMLGSPIYMAPQVLKGEIYTIKADIWSLGVVLFQMIYGRCPFESKSIAKLINMLNEEDIKIPETPKISPLLQKLIRRMLVKDYVNRIDWKEIFEYTISESGDIFPPSQMGLRQSYKQQIPNDSHNNSGIVMAPGQNGNNANPNKSNNSGNNVNNGSNVSNGHSTNNGSNANSVNSANQGNPQAFGNNYSSPPSIYSYQNNSAVSSSPINQGSKTPSVVSPKVKSIDLMKSIDDDTNRNKIMKKKSPTKQFEKNEYSISIGDHMHSNLVVKQNTSSMTNSGTLLHTPQLSATNPNNSLHSGNSTLQNGNSSVQKLQPPHGIIHSQSSYQKNDRNLRMESLIKSHSRCTLLNQLTLQVMKSEQVRVIYLAYYLVKSVDRELNGLWESIKKEAGEYGGNGVNAPDALKEFKLLVEREIDTLKVPCQLVRECVDQDGEYKWNQLDSRRQEIIRQALEALRVGSMKEEELVLFMLLMDYLQENALLKRDSYDKVPRDTLQRQLRNKIGKLIGDAEGRV